MRDIYASDDQAHQLNFCAPAFAPGEQLTRLRTVEQAAQSEVGRERVSRIAERVKERRARKREGGPEAEDAPT